MQLWWQQFLLIFLRTNVIFCTKTVKQRKKKLQLSWGTMYSESNGQRNHAIGVRIPLEGAIFFGGGHCLSLCKVYLASGWYYPNLESDIGDAVFRYKFCSILLSRRVIAVRVDPVNRTKFKWWGVFSGIFSAKISRSGDGCILLIPITLCLKRCLVCIVIACVILYGHYGANIYTYY